jgi:hypothetical protein
MAHDGDDMVSLPSPPPPRSAARREAIDAALRKFDGIEDAPARKPQRPRLGWASLQGRPAGAMVAAAMVAIIGIPAIQIAIRDNPTPVAEESAAPDLVAPGQDAADRSPLVPEARPTAPTEVLAEEASSPSQLTSEPAPAVSEGRLGFAPDRAEKAGMAAPAAPPMMAPPPPAPPPPPPPAEPQAEASAADSVVVTGSRVSRPNLESASPTAIVQSDAVDAPTEFLPRLQQAFAANDRHAILGLAGLPLKVNFSGDTRTYRTRRDVDRDFDRIFTAEVRRSVLNLHPDALTTRGDLTGNGRIWFGCGKRSCASGDTIRIRQVSP